MNKFPIVLIVKDNIKCQLMFIDYPVVFVYVWSKKKSDDSIS